MTDFKASKFKFESGGFLSLSSLLVAKTFVRLLSPLIHRHHRKEEKEEKTEAEQIDNAWERFHDPLRIYKLQKKLMGHSRPLFRYFRLFNSDRK